MIAACALAQEVEADERIRQRRREREGEGERGGGREKGRDLEGEVGRGRERGSEEVGEETMHVCLHLPQYGTWHCVGVVPYTSLPKTSVCLREPASSALHHTLNTHGIYPSMHHVNSTTYQIYALMGHFQIQPTQHFIRALVI